MEKQINDTTLLDELNQQLEEYRKQGYNIPGVTRLTMKPPYMRPVINIVKVSTNTDDKEIYETDGGKFYLGRLAIQKFRSAGGIGFDSLEESFRNSSVSVKLVGKRYDLDGTIAKVPDGKEINLIANKKALESQYTENVNKEHKDWAEDKKKQYVEEAVKGIMLGQSQYAYSMAITGAQTRVVQKLLGLKAAYTLEELEKPFAIVSLVPEIDTKDPEIKRMIAAHALGIRDFMYQTGKGIPSIDEIHEEAFKEKLQKTGDDLFSASKSKNNDFDEYPRDLQVKLAEKISKASSAEEKVSIAA